MSIECCGFFFFSLFNQFKPQFYYFAICSVMDIIGGGNKKTVSCVYFKVVMVIKMLE